MQAKFGDWGETRQRIGGRTWKELELWSEGARGTEFWPISRQAIEEEAHPYAKVCRLSRRLGKGSGVLVGNAAKHCRRTRTTGAGWIGSWLS